MANNSGVAFSLLFSIVVVNSQRLSERCFRTEPALAFVRNLFQNGYPPTMIDMLKHSVRLPEQCFLFLLIAIIQRGPFILLSVDYEMQ